MNPRVHNPIRPPGQLPRQFWAVAALVCVTIMGVAGESNRSGVNWAGAIVMALVLLGLANHSQLCRWFLLILSLGGALSLVIHQAEHGIAGGDVVLTVVCLGEAALLSSPAMRAYTDRRWPIAL